MAISSVEMLQSQKPDVFGRPRNAHSKYSAKRKKTSTKPPVGSQTLSWRVGAYRQPAKAPPRDNGGGSRGILVLEERIYDVNPPKAMPWTSPIGDAADDGAFFHYYCTTIPMLGYGIRSDGLWSPVRAMSAPCGLASSSQYRWMIILSQMHITARRGVPLPMSLHKRKAAAYKDLNDALSSPTTRYSFETILSVNAALFVEARTVAPEVTRVHLKALDQLFVSRKSRFAEAKDSFAALLRLSFYTAYLLCECEASSYDQLYDTATRAVAKLNAIRVWVDETLTKKLDPVVGRQHEDLRDFHAARQRFLQHEAVSPLIAPCSTYMGYSHIASLFGALLLLNLSLYELGPHVATFFLNRLSLIIENSMAVDPSTNKPLLKLPALPMAMAQARLDVLHNFTRSELGIDDNVTDESYETRTSMVDALKVFSYLDESRRKSLILLLRGWLDNDHETPASGRDDEFDDLHARVEKNWIRQKTKTAGSPNLA